MDVSPELTGQASQSLRFRLIPVFQKMETWGVYLLCFVLPSLNGPKHIASVLLMLGALGWRWADPRVSRRRPDLLEWLLIAMWGITLIGILVNLPSDCGLDAIREPSRQYLIFWVVYRGACRGQTGTGTSDDGNRIHLETMAVALGAGLLLGLGWGIVDWMTGKEPYLELHSSGLVTHASIYVAMMTLVGAGILADRNGFVSVNLRRLMTGVTVLAFPCLFIMGSRATLLAFFLAVMPLVFTIWRPFAGKLRYWILGAAAVCVSVFMIGALVPSSGIERMTHLVSSRVDWETGTFHLGESDRIRMEFWNIGLTQALQAEHPLWGIGSRNFQAIDLSALDFRKPPEKIIRNKIETYHAHNLYLTKWAEEGLIGLISLILFQMYLAVRIFSAWPRSGTASWVWVAGYAGFVIPLIACQFHSRYYNEFAWLSMILLAMMLGHDDSRFLYKNFDT
ncbi:MAG: hypothetical protein CSA22_07900 [Deltaproteobacteria bacterium]|nr:MAG: hypothetical protein CSA22_07900 [Deltaproteobacteria bacterium]